MGSTKRRGAMYVFNFQRRFATPIVTLIKGSTMRLPRIDGRDPEPGDDLRLYTGQRTSDCQLLGDTACTDRKWAKVFRADGVGHVIVDDQPLDGSAIAQFSMTEGFTDTDDLYDWVDQTHGGNFAGYLYYWDKSLLAASRQTISLQVRTKLFVPEVP